MNFNSCTECGHRQDQLNYLGYPNNSLRIVTAYRKLLDNIDKIPIEKIEELTKDYD